MLVIMLTLATLVQGAAGSFNLAWDYPAAPPSVPVGFKFMQRVGAGPYTEVGTVPYVAGQTTFTFTTAVLPDGSYSFQVFAYNMSGAMVQLSGGTNEATAINLPPPSPATNLRFQ
jgi:hypothetical protein